MARKNQGSGSQDRPPHARFRALLESAGKTATGFEVPAEVLDVMGSGKRPPVVVRINDHSYRSTVAVMGGRFMLGVSADNRESAGVAAGDEVDVELTLDTAPRVVNVPDDFARALEREPKAAQLFEALTSSQKSWHTLAIEGAKTTETRERRIAKSVSLLAAGRKTG